MRTSLATTAILLRRYLIELFLWFCDDTVRELYRTFYSSPLVRPRSASNSLVPERSLSQCERARVLGEACMARVITLVLALDKPRIMY